MNKNNVGNVAEMVADALVKAGSTFSEDKKKRYLSALKEEQDEKSRWVLETILKNAEIAEKNRTPLCDDTGIPHVIVDLGKGQALTDTLLSEIESGVKLGLKKLPGRPMAVKGNDIERLEQSIGLYEEPEALAMAPIIVRKKPGTGITIHILMLGGGPAIRGKTYRVYHKHNKEAVVEEIVSWAKESVKLLGCSPCTLAIGIGRSQYEAANLMMQAMTDGDQMVQSKLESEITKKVNESGVGALGLGGNVSVLATFLKVGPQRASGVRIVSMRPCCCFEPRTASVEL